MLTYAYLVLSLDVTTDPPSVASVGVFSEPTPTCSLNLRTFIMGEAVGKSYEDAHKYAILTLFHNPMYRWCHPYLDDRTRSQFDKI